MGLLDSLLSPTPPVTPPTDPTGGNPLVDPTTDSTTTPIELDTSASADILAPVVEAPLDLSDIVEAPLDLSTPEAPETPADTGATAENTTIPETTSETPIEDTAVLTQNTISETVPTETPIETQAPSEISTASSSGLDLFGSTPQTETPSETQTETIVPSTEEDVSPASILTDSISQFEILQSEAEKELADEQQKIHDLESQIHDLESQKADTETAAQETKEKIAHLSETAQILRDRLMEESKEN